MRPVSAAIGVVVATAVLTAGCSGGQLPSGQGPGQTDFRVAETASRPASGSAAASPGPSTGGASGSAVPTSKVPTPVQCAAQLVEGMSLPERAGQLVMVGITDAGSSELTALRRHHIGSVILMGTRTDGVVGVKRVTGRLAWKGQKVPVLVAADQEGGTVQRLKGPGFEAIPAASVQATWTNTTLRSRATRWGRQLAAAGVHWTLAPVADVVPASMGRRNEPIGALRRGYGANPTTVAGKVTSFIDGMQTAGVATSAKHFPGIGRVVGHTDFAAGVRDTATTPHDALLRPFQAAIESSVPSIMVSTVTYTRIDAHQPAVFSPSVIGIVRDLGFAGVVISDDLGSARSVAAVPAKQRAIRFVKAGGDVAITADPTLADEFVDGIVAAAKSSGAVATAVERSATRMLTLKVEQGLLPCG